MENMKLVKIGGAARQNLTFSAKVQTAVPTETSFFSAAFTIVVCCICKHYR